MSLEVTPILCRAGRMDNYAYLIIDSATRTSAIVDPSEAAPIVNVCQKAGITPNYILNTHHHYDHTDANLELKELYRCKIVGAAKDAQRIPGLDIAVSPGETFMLGRSAAQIIEADGHTIGHILWYFAQDKILFTGDVLFNLCIGGLFEGTTAQMFETLSKIKALPDDVIFYPGHEYTIHGIDFAARMNHNKPEMAEYINLARQRLSAGKSVAPVNLKLEKACNPYLQADSEEQLSRLC